MAIAWAHNLKSIILIVETIEVLLEVTLAIRLLVEETDTLEACILGRAPDGTAESD